DEFLVLQYEGVLKEFSTKERKLTGVEYEDAGIMFIDGTFDVTGFYKDGEVTLYNREGSSNDPFPCTKEQLHADVTISNKDGGNYKIVNK
ncbi:MAG: hypothetical protein RSG95_03575, partial [Bacilli bacterium]